MIWRKAVTALADGARQSCTQLPARLALHRTYAASSLPARLTVSGFRNIASRRNASSTTATSSTTDPREVEVNDLLLKGIQCMADGDPEGAKEAYTRSIQIRETPAALYNLALALYQLHELPASIEAFERSLALHPSADAHTNVASAYILSTPPNAPAAIEHLQKAIALSPDDGEIHFNMGVIFEASERLEDALREYTRSQELGIERASQCVRNVGGKIFQKKRQAIADADTEKAS